MITQLHQGTRVATAPIPETAARLSGVRAKKDLTPFTQPLRETMGWELSLSACAGKASCGPQPGLINLPGSTPPCASRSFSSNLCAAFHSRSMAPTVLQRCKMYTANDALDRIHPRLMALIEHQKAICGCTMKAVRQVAKRVGASEFWVRRVTGRYGKVKIQAHQFFNVCKEHVRVNRAKSKAAKAARILSREKTHRAGLSA